MISTITTMPATRAMIATGTFGRARTLASETAVEPSGLSVSRRDETSASSYGSGRSSVNDRSAAAPTKTTGTRYAPLSSGRPRLSARAPAGAARFGPMTAPAVAPHTTSPMADAARSVGTRSAAV